MQPLQYDWRRPADKDNSITHAAAAPSKTWRSHCTAICNQRFNKRIELRTHEQGNRLTRRPCKGDEFKIVIF